MTLNLTDQEIDAIMAKAKADAISRMEFEASIRLSYLKDKQSGMVGMPRCLCNLAYDRICPECGVMF